MNTPGQKNGIYEFWPSDCGASGVCTGSPILRARHTTVEYQGPSDNKQIKSYWFENWSNPVSTGKMWYDQIIVSRDGQIIAELAGDEQSLDDAAAVAGTNEYSVVGQIGTGESKPATCEVFFVLDTGPEFIRGDANSNGSISLADAQTIWSYSVGAGAEIDCLDAADANDDGSVGIPDGSLVSQYIFDEGDEPPAPFPDCGTDDTADDDDEDLGCEGPVEPCDDG